MLWLSILWPNPHTLIILIMPAASKQLPTTYKSPVSTLPTVPEAELYDDFIPIIDYMVLAVHANTKVSLRLERNVFCTVSGDISQQLCLI
ncbi:hypothetical protein DKX38_026155 [Salix brachista]|uniref:Uncharacterized protein n=1 Tax=Salix brachista TaxID=2182728 RepID=A0A5N5JSQ9_9ROSI|nr:hypothetical protein DKX38_026155 [Salix brachista]